MNASAPVLLKAVLEASWQGSLVIVLILLVRPLLGWRVPARWRSLLWSLALLRLLVPAFLLPSSPASLQNLPVVDRPFEQAGLTFATPDPTPALSNSGFPQGPETGEGSSVTPPSVIPAAPAWGKIVAGIWLGGFGLAGLIVILTTVRLHRRLHRDSVPVEEDIRNIFGICCARLGLRRRPRLIATGGIDSPALVGLFRPTLLIPKATLRSFSAGDWEHVFLHELAHYRRRDHWTQALQLVVLCIHWFNPLVWFSFRYLRADRELATDEWALRHLDSHRLVAYGDTLLKVLGNRSQPRMASGMVGILEDGAQLKERLRHIVAFGSRRIFGSFAGLSLLLTLSVLVLGRAAPEPDLTNYEGLSPVDILVSAARSGDRPAVEKMLADGVDVNGLASLRGERTALTAAAAASQLEIVRLLLDKGADINLKPDKGSPPVVVACKKGWLEGAEFLLGKGAVCAPELPAAAHGETAAIDRFLATGPTDFEQLKTLCEVAAANGHAPLFETLFDAARMLPGHADWEIGNGPIVNAVARGHREVADAMIRRDGSVHSEVVRFSAAAARTKGMREWLESKGFKVPEYNDGERLIDAAEREDLPEIRRLLKAGVDIGYRGESDWTPITKAATWGCPKAVKLLLENHADPNTRKHSHSALRLAKTTEIADLLFAAGADVNAQIGNTHIISYCVTFGPIEMVKWFLDHGVDPAKVKSDNATLLFDARTADIARLLIERGVDVKAQNKGGGTALHQIGRYGQNAAAVMRVLLEHGADPNAPDGAGFTPLMVARDGACVDVLVEFGADVHASTPSGYDALTSHSHGTDASRLEALLRHGLKLDAKNGPYILAHAASWGQNDTVKFLLEQGVDPNAKSPMNLQTEHEWLPLATTIYRDDYAVAKLLVEHGADASECIRYAAAQGRPRLARLFWEHGFRKISELCYAVTQSAPLAELERLLAPDGRADPAEDTGITPLGAAAVLGHMETVKFLIEHGANPNAGQPPALTISANRGQAEAVAYLLDHGGKPTPSLVNAVANNSNPYSNEAPIENFNRIMKALIAHGALEGCSEAQASDILKAATITRNPGGNPVVIQMLLEAGLDVHARSGNVTSFGDNKAAEGATQSVLEVIPLAAKSGCWQVKPEVAALLEKAAAKPEPAR